jgi:hypothetical protein
VEFGTGILEKVSVLGLQQVSFGGLVVIMLAIGPKVHRLRPG